MQNSSHLSTAIETLRQLVSFDTTSRNSNLALIEWVETLVSPLGAKTRRIPSSDRTKSNLIVSFGPVEAPGGIILSGHTDVVPVDGQNWSSDPWQLVEKDGKLYGRGTCDMKGFSACALALAPLMTAAKLKAPIHIALSYDEEIGCLGAPSLVEVIRSDYAPIDAVIIGEPSDMKVVSGQKGLSTHQVTVLGFEAHSSQVQQGVSAIMEAIPLLAALKGLADKARMDAPADGPYTPTGTTLTIGLIDGGTAANILARECTFTFDMRFEDDASLYELESKIGQMVAKLDQEIKIRAPLGGASLVRKSFTPAMKPEVNGKAEALARALTGDNTLRAVAYGTEGGIFQNGGMSTIICGPGSITQAHQQNEFVEISQLASCVTFLERLVKHLSH